MLQILIFILGMIFLTMFSLLLFQYVGRYIYWYKIKGNYILVLLFGLFPFYWIRLSNIVDVNKISHKNLFILLYKEGQVFCAAHMANRVWGEIVIINKRVGLTRWVTITPDHADDFIQEVKSKMSE